ncbi:hypothetical protein niasHT_032356 [Heterodera trifolii]|uniref:Uncharacterized protein n=1 Tax=Heterodera trifolii TaxID=157864 RepID=A0ABD2HUM3_9BILA
MATEQQPSDKMLTTRIDAEGDDGRDNNPIRDIRRRVHFSDRSQRVLDDSDHLLKSIRTRRAAPLATSMSMSTLPTSLERNGDQSLQDHARKTLIRAQRSVSPEEPLLSASTSRYLQHTPKFPRIDFDDWIEEETQAKKPAWKVLQENVKSSYNKPRATAERHRNLNDFQSAQMDNLEFNRARRRRESAYLPFTELTHLDGESFLPRAPSWMASGALAPRGMSKLINTAGSGPYCAPHVDRSQGIERPEMKRYTKMVDDVTARLLKTSILPEHMKTFTRKEFREAPKITDELAADDELMPYMPRPYYSRPNRLDKDYFDFDLQHSVDMFRRPEGKYLPTPPQPWETKLIKEFKAKGEAPLSGHIFTKGPADYRASGTSYLSAALRTPSFWEHRFASIGNQIRQSDPISFESLERLRPRPSRFTTYSDPDFEDYEDPKAADD